MAADRLTPDEDAFDRWRSAGFTTVVTGPSVGFFTGNTAVVNLGAERPSSMVVMTPAAQRFNLSGGPGHRGFPNSLAGAFAYGKQFLSDAGYYRRAKELYEANPRGRERPTYDRALEGILPVQAGDQPLLFPATTATEIRRALRTSDEMGVRPIVYGAGAGYGVAGELARSAVPVLVSLDWPEVPANPDPTQDVPLEELRHRLLAPTTPARFQEAGVRFAFYSEGGSASDAISGARTAVEAGLSHDQAVRALTLSAAEIFEVDDRIGSLEVGKIANLTITDGDLLDEEASVRMVFVDGQQFEFDGGSDERTGARAGRSGNGRRDADDEGVSNSGPSATELRSRIGVSHRVAYRDDAVTVIQNATILTITNGTIENGSILIRNGKIAEVGTDVSVPRGAHVVDAAGQYVMPGIIDAHTHIGGGFNEGSVNVSAMTGVHDVINPDDVNIYRALAGGVTSVNVLHGSANPIGGQNAVLKLRWGSDADGLVMQGAPPGIKFALGENPKRGGGWPATRMGVNDVIRQAFVEAEQYQADWDAYRAGGDDGVPPRRDLELEALAEILSGERLVHAHAYRQDEILQLIRLAEEFGFRVATFQHVLEGYKVAKEIAEHGAAASTFSDWWGYKMEAYDAIPYNAAIMVEKGVSVSINSDSNEEMRHLNQEAAKTMKWGGMTETQALSMITINPARQLGVADQVGSIEVGKDADIVIFDRHPLDNFSIPQKTYVDGKLYFDIEGDRERQRAIDDEKEALTSETGGRRVTTDAPDVEPSREGGVR
jgi:imidazolonepropionase-like amidohydrolase